MKHLCDLLFELSSEDRMSILQSLSKENIRLSHLAQKLDLTVTETSRQLQRLVESDLVSRNPEGLYNITSFGEFTLFLIPSIKFVSDNRKFFLDHDISKLPYYFKNRISELSNCTFTDDTVKVFSHARDMLLNAEEFIWIQSYQHLLWNSPIAVEKIKEGLDFRFILPFDLDDPENYEPDDLITQRTKNLENMDLRVVVTDKEASLSFPYKDGRIDFTAFMSSDLIFCKWCGDLFQYYWERAR